LRDLRNGLNESRSLAVSYDAHIAWRMTFGPAFKFPRKRPPQGISKIWPVH